MKTLARARRGEPGLSPRTGAHGLPVARRYCRHGGSPDWGVGVVLWGDAEAHELTVFFEHRGLIVVSVKRPVLLDVATDRVDAALRGRLEAAIRGYAPPVTTGLSPRRVVRRQPVEREPAPPEAARSSPRDDDSTDVMDRRRRIPGSFEGGKRR